MPPDIHCERALTGNKRSGLFCVCRKIAGVGELTTTLPATFNEWSQAPCLMTSLSVAPATMTLVEAPHPGGLSAAVTVVVWVPVSNGAVDPVGVGRSVRTGVLPVEARAAMIAAMIVVLEVGQIARDSVVARC